MISVTNSAAIWGGILFFVGGLALLGFVKKSVLDGLLETVQSLEARVKAMAEDLKDARKGLHAAKSDIAKLKADSELKSRQLGVSLRVIEYFERVVTVVIKSKPRIPGEVISRIDEALRDLAKYREQAYLELESMEVNQAHYDWLIARSAIMGPQDGSLGEGSGGPHTLETKEEGTE